MKLIYDLRNDEDRILAYQDASRDTDGGLTPSRGLFGSDEWWDAVEAGSIPTQTCAGVVSSVDDGPMGDWPTVRVATADGHVRSWSALGGITGESVGKRVSIQYVQQEPKKPPFRGYRVDIVVRVFLEE